MVVSSFSVSYYCGGRNYFGEYEVNDNRGVRLANWIENKVTESWLDKLFTL